MIIQHILLRRLEQLHVGEDTQRQRREDQVQFAEGEAGIGSALHPLKGPGFSGL